MSLTDPDELRRQADEIVRRPEFREEPPSLVERGLDWIFERLGDLIGPVAGSGGYAVGYGILIVAIAVIGYLLWRVFPRGRLLSSPESFTVTSRTELRRSRAEWLAEAEQAEAAGDWERAVHARYHAIAAGLADGERLPSAPSTTAGERRRAFAQHEGEPGSVTTFDGATDTYEHVWFGGRSAGRPDSQRLADADRSLLDGGSS